MSAHSKTGTEGDIPGIKFFDCLFALEVEETHQMVEDTLPNAKLELMHHIRCEELVAIHAKGCEPLGECALCDYMSIHEKRRL